MLFPKKELDLSTPKVMGVLNLTPDSFFDGGKFLKKDNTFDESKVFNSIESIDTFKRNQNISMKNNL